MSTLEVQRITHLKGRLRPPSDKSLTHRALMFGAIAEGECEIQNPLMGEDCMSTLRCLMDMGMTLLRLDNEGARVLPSPSWIQPSAPLDCGNSGTTMRLLSGLIAARPITATLFGDASLSRRPMGRIATPLRLMGATVEGDKPPITIQGGNLQPIRYESPVASAQVKSCVLLAGLGLDGITEVVEPLPSRDHTERMLSALGVDIRAQGTTIRLQGPGSLPPFRFSVPADISSAAFWAVGAAMLSGSEVTLQQVGANPSRTGLLDVLSEAGVPLVIEPEESELGEPVVTITVRAPQQLQPFSIEGALVPRLVDEIPVLAVLATQCDGVTTIRDAQELRVKESDRIALVVESLTRMGANIEAHEDGMTITGPTPLLGTTIEAHGDHRIAMAFAIAGLIAEGTTCIHGAESIDTSYPTFREHLALLANAT